MTDPIRLLVHDPQTGDRNMAVDEALMRSAREGRVTLRLYRWEPGCLSFGRNQTARGAYDPEGAAARGIDVVRRPTGGRAVYHHAELTYSVTAPSDTWGSLREAYCRINRALAEGLRELGVPAACAGESARRGRAPGPTASACFRNPLPGEVTVGGRKLIGSAQWRDGGALLQHGSLLLRNEQAVTESLRTQRLVPAPGGEGGPGETAAESGAIALDELLARPPSPEELVAALAAGFEREFVRPVRPGALSPVVASLADELSARYRDPEWTWRR
ncbi:MAG: lipoate--protein ligase family protein [Gemmatimonadota bacterium]